jgi:DHA1 family tetracycline resistance protein-like MFS transporter
MLFLGRVIDGLAAGNISTARSYMVDMAGDDKKERMKAMGMIGAIFGMGFIIGPAIGGLAGAMHGSLPFFIVAIMSSINFFLAYFILPETLLHADTKHFKDAFKVNPFSPIIRAFGDKLRVSGYFSWLLMLTSAGVYQGIFAIYLQKVFGRGQGEVGLAMAITGVMMVLMQIYFLPKLTHAFEEVVIEKVSFVILIISFLFMAVPYITVFYFGMILSILSQSMLRVTINHGLLHNSESSQGEIMGVTGALMSVSMIFGPLIAGFVFSFSSVLVFATASFIALLSMFSARNFRLKVVS